MNNHQENPGEKEVGPLSNNRLQLEQLLKDQAIPIVHGAMLDQSPSALPEDFEFAKVEGMLLGGT